MKQSDDLRYVHQDHLTGTALVTSANGDSLGTMKYYPYGGRIDPDDYPTDKLFTCQRLTPPETMLGYINFFNKPASQITF